MENLLTQPFKQCPHWDLNNLNLHAWLLEPQPFSKQASLTKWQRKLRLLRDAEPEPSMSQNGPFLSDGVRTGYQDKPNGRRVVPSWNLSLVLHQLTKAPFELLWKALLKHLTLKIVFLLALGSGKRRSKIHAWFHRNIRHQEDWSNVSLYPSPSFISKNHLVKE